MTTGTFLNISNQNMHNIINNTNNKNINYNNYNNNYNNIDNICNRTGITYINDLCNIIFNKFGNIIDNNIMNNFNLIKLEMKNLYNRIGVLEDNCRTLQENLISNQSRYIDLQENYNAQLVESKNLKDFKELHESDMDQKKFCCICLTNIKTHTAVPCFHYAYCEECISKLPNNSCAICKKECSFQKIFEP